MSVDSATAPYAVPVGRVARGVLRPPGSKSLTNRALILALLGSCRVEVEHPLASEDIDALLAALVRLGMRIERRPGALLLDPGRRPSSASIDCHQSGTMARLLCGALAGLPGTWTLDGAPRLRERPMGPLATSLRALGVAVEELGDPGTLPLRITGRRLAGGRVTVDASESSQYLSGLLLAGLVASAPLEVEVAALASAPYVDLTIDAAAGFGGRIERDGSVFRVLPGLRVPPRVAIEPDASSAIYPLAAAALTGGEVVVEGIPSTSRQGDLEALELLERMGARIARRPSGIRVAGGAGLVAIDADLGRIPDQVPTFAALAPFASGVTRLRGVAHLRVKESDRLAAMRTELERLGAVVVEHSDGLEIPGVWAAGAPSSNRVEVDSWDDHRIAMSLALVGLRRPGVAIGRPQVVAKSWPGFWSALESLLQPTP